ncbi:aminopyrimidine aminohydrolase [Rhodococcoides trifolii]|uniref:Aminopyrimidine aminohydrolase n=1 Tax=Rhodococcoides trifolii TaxID=908250 RepID=A0A917CZ35_9NOCA|nr:TenA family protein [Rhodococcus trifolii]GGG00496.1 aminopyrimidine aminohydrolase [Rhodococcus trifolii]
MTAVPDTRFTDDLWLQTKALREQIDELDFLRRLGDGTLPLDAFHTYIEQDGLYLEGYAKALALLASRAPDAESGAFWATSSATAAVVEKSLHTSLLPERPDGPSAHSQSCLGYVSFLIAAAATESYGVAAAAVLPCFWIYAEVGRDLAASAQDVLASDPNHPYARWVTTYDAEEFQESARRARELVDAAAESATGGERAKMAGAFVVAMRYELLFWDTALHPQPWPAS